ncbi:MAG: AIPR family protein [Acidobacteriia bacterium]|nr:AIPR family protein [Terriglobia bacterium]
MQLKDKIKQILHKEYPEEKAWKAFIYWWLAANGYEYDAGRSLVEFTDGSKDGGIDVIAWPLESQSRKEVLVVQSKYFRQPPTEKELQRFQGAIAALNGSLNDFQTWLGTCRDELHHSYRNLRDERRRHRYILIAPCRFRGALKRSLRRKNIDVHDADMLANLERIYSVGKTPRLDEIRIPGASPLRRVAENDGIGVWVFTAPARELGLAFERHGNALFAGNIRYALQGDTARRVRKGMYDTLREAPHEFVFSHNGITITGDKIHKRGKAVVMRSATVVNGAQTVSYLGNPTVMKNLAHNPAQVIVKFIEVDEAELLNDIESKVAYRSNNQNKVSPSDLMIELPSLVSLQRYFRRHGVHIERKKGEQKLHFGEPGISKERLAQVLAAVESSEGAVKGKRKQELFMGPAQRLFSDFAASEKSRAEAIAWARVDDIFRATVKRFANAKRRKRAQLAQLASLRVFHRVIQATQLKIGFLHAMTRWDSDNDALEKFLERSFKAVISALLRCSSQHKKNEPAFYKALESVKPAVRSATWHCRRKVRHCYHQYLSS